MARTRTRKPKPKRPQHTPVSTPRNGLSDLLDQLRAEPPKKKKSAPQNKGSAANRQKLERLQASLDPNERLCTRRGVPGGYRFVPKGDVYVTRNCRTRTLDQGQTLYVIYSPGKYNRTGLACPSAIADSVASDATATKTRRAAAVRGADARAAAHARTALTAEFPRIPLEHAERVLSHAFAKGSGRVGRTATLDNDQKLELAVRAHVRHGLTLYDKLVRELGKVKARKEVEAEVGRVVEEWRQG